MSGDGDKMNPAPPEPELKSLGSRVATARQGAGMTQAELAAAATAVEPDEDDRPKHSALGAAVAENAMALRVTADAVFELAVSGGGTAAACHVCRALALGLRTIERDAMRATRPGWKPADDRYPLDADCIDGEEEA